MPSIVDEKTEERAIFHDTCELRPVHAPRQGPAGRLSLRLYRDSFAQRSTEYSCVLHHARSARVRERELCIAPPKPTPHFSRTRRVCARAPCESASSDPACVRTRALPERIDLADPSQLLNGTGGFCSTEERGGFDFPARSRQSPRSPVAPVRRGMNLKKVRTLTRSPSPAWHVR